MNPMNTLSKNNNSNNNNIKEKELKDKISLYSINMNTSSEKTSTPILNMRLPKFVKATKKAISKKDKTLLRKEFGIKTKSVIKVIDEITKIRGSGNRFRNENYAYYFLSQLYNDIINDVREDIIIQRAEAKKKNDKLRKQRKQLTKDIQKIKLSQKPFTINVSKYGFTIKELLELINNVRKGANTILTITYQDGTEKLYTMNEFFYERISNITDSQLEENNEVMNESDMEFVNTLNAIKKITISNPIIVKNKSGSIKTKNGGAYFSYLNKTDFDLTKYGCYKSVLPSNYDVNCLIKCFIAYGVSEDKINLLKSFVVNREIPMCKLTQVADKVKMSIKLRKQDTHKKPYVYGKDYKEQIEIGLVDKHYFLIEKVDFTMYALKNYFKLIEKHTDIDDMKYIIKDNGSKDKKRVTDSYKVMNFLYEQREEYLEPIALCNEVLSTQFYDKAFDFDKLDYPEENALLNEYDEDKEDFKMSMVNKFTNVFFDFETYESINDGVSIHTPYMVCAKFDDGRKITKTGIDCGKKLLDTLTYMIEEDKDKNRNVRLIAHNCGYDYRFMFKYLFDINQITKGKGLLNSKAKFKSFKTGNVLNVEFKDSCKLITMPLKKFSKVFKLPIEKEVMPYGLYNKENCEKEWVEVSEARKYLKNDNDFKHLVSVCEKLKIIEKQDGKKYFNCMDYSEYYCMLDCEVLQSGYNKFREWIFELGIDINAVWTSASLSDKYFMMNDVYEGVYKLSGLPRIFIQKCVVGGRTMCRDNVKHKIVDKKISDYDGVSLYPSSMYRMEGILKGKPKVLSSNQLNKSFLDSVDGYFVKVEITKVGIDRHFSLMSEVNEEGVRVFHNDMVRKIQYVDKTMLEDMINFQGVECDILCGYYYDEGRNDIIRQVIKNVFDTRVRMKAEGNPIQEVYKLIMNSGYGRSILKPIENEEVIISEKDIDSYISKYYNYIVEVVKGYDCDKFIVKKHKTINEHFNNCVFGVEVLSMSKRIMNEVMCLAEDNNLKIYYQDTDSLHIEKKDIPVLEQKFMEKYNRQIEGKDLGQFHIDFELEGAISDTIYAEKSVFLGKKCYIDCLVGKDKDGNEIRGNHIRMKGVSTDNITFIAEQNKCEVYDLYNRMYNGESIEFDLTNGGNKSIFEFNKNMSVSYNKEFKRVIKFE